MKIVLVIGSQNRHLSIANELIKNFTIKDIILCNRHQVPQIARPKSWITEDSVFLKKHLTNLENDEINLIGKNNLANFKKLVLDKNINIFNVNNRYELNNLVSDKKFNSISFDYDAIVVYGSWILEDPIFKLLKKTDKQFINIHGGISPFFRGSSTLLWPLILSQPELMGFTIHELDNQIDHGPIFNYIFPDLKKGMAPTQMMAACQLSLQQNIAECISNCVEFKLKGLIQDSYGKTFLEKDYRPNCLKTIYLQFNEKLFDIDEDTILERRMNYLGKYGSLIFQK